VKVLRSFLKCFILTIIVTLTITSFFRMCNACLYCQENHKCPCDCSRQPSHEWRDKENKSNYVWIHTICNECGHKIKSVRGEKK